MTRAQTERARLREQGRTCLPDRPNQGSSQYVNISHMVTPNIHTSEECEKEPKRRLSGAHLQKPDDFICVW